MAIGGFLAERWDQQAAHIDLAGASQLRAFNPEKAYLLLDEEGYAIIPEYLSEAWGTEHLEPMPQADNVYLLPDSGDVGQVEAAATFENGLALVSTSMQMLDGDPAQLEIVSTWRADRALDLPPYPLLSKPPAPGQDDTPRLAIFVQLLASDERVAGDDGLGVDPYTLYAGDAFVQRHLLDTSLLQPGVYQIVMGLYDPLTGQRVLNAGGTDMVRLDGWTVP